MYRIEWTTPEVEIADVAGHSGVVTEVHWDCSGQVYNGDGTWTEVSRQRGVVDLPYRRPTNFAPVDNLTQRDVLVQWVFPVIDAPAIEAAVVDGIERHLRKIVLPHRSREIERHVKLAAQRSLLEMDIPLGMNETDLEAVIQSRVDAHLELEAEIAKLADPPSVTPEARDVNAEGVDVLGRDETARLPLSFRVAAEADVKGS